jgi:probable HAF family extracellular repeat protein
VAVAVNANGQVFGRSDTSDTMEGQPPHALSWTQAGGMVDLGTLVDGTFNQAYAVNASGQVVGFSETMEGQTHAFAWTQAFGIVDLGTLVGGTFSQAQAVNDSGQVVGHSGTAMGFGNNAVLWTLPVRQLTALNTAHLWIGLKNSDDQGTQFDLLVKVFHNGTPVASGLKRCITGVTRNPSRATEAMVGFDPFPAVTLNSGDALALKVSTRIGTTPTGAKCSGPGAKPQQRDGLAALLRFSESAFAVRCDDRAQFRYRSVFPLQRHYVWQ